MKKKQAKSFNPTIETGERVIYVFAEMLEDLESEGIPTSYAQIQLFAYIAACIYSILGQDVLDELYLKGIQFGKELTSSKKGS